MPARKRPKTPTKAVDPITQFAQRLKAAEAAEVAAKAAEQSAIAHAIAVDEARDEVTRTIEVVKAARRNRAGVAEADAAWRAAKARLVELETGEAPSWAPAVVTGDEAADAGSADGNNGSAADETETSDND